ncbi:unnamed protein product [Danaus chrysippus]|uniref:(African queen) hypothetical protein n=1 Tax=Danaus chrysippus TaxID=151541 RepID=A0A8J2W5C5_9NEOP|nr:unnamed protein product [Danaus chrysippus]
MGTDSGATNGNEMLTRTGYDEGTNCTNDMALLTDSDTSRKGLVTRSDTDDTACLTDLRKGPDGGEKRAMTPSALPPRDLKGRSLRTKKGSSKGPLWGGLGHCLQAGVRGHWKNTGRSP